MISSLVIQPVAMLTYLQGMLNTNMCTINLYSFCTCRIEVEYISNSTNCAWMPITHAVIPNSCYDLSTTYFQPTQLLAR